MSDTRNWTDGVLGVPASSDDYPELTDRADDSEFRAHLLTFRTLAASQQSIYTTFLKESEKIKDVVTDENARIKIMARFTSEREREAVLKAIDDQISAMNARRQLLMESSPKSLIQQRVENLEGEINNLRVENNSMEHEIERLQNQITDMRNKQRQNNGVIMRLKIDLDNSKQELETPMDKALNQVKGELLAKKDLIKAS